MQTFDELNLSSALLKAIKELGYQKPTPVQIQTLPILLGEPTDFVGQAATGTGKTAAFAIPLIEQINFSKKSVQALILCPNRELALQVTGQIKLLGKYKNVRAMAIYGGVGYAEQLEELRKLPQIIVATPGRLLEHLSRESICLDEIKTIVLDEADEMLSMGFQDELEQILDAALGEHNHLWLFSATMSKEVRYVAEEYLLDPQMVQTNQQKMLAAEVSQIYYSVRESDKPEILCKLIEAADSFYGLIFCQTKTLVVELTHYLSSRGYAVDCLHGDKTQTDREQTMQAFRSHKLSILVCTDVASRGLDVQDLTHVVNYSIPRELEVYVHRIGRTARSGKAGIAMSLVTPSPSQRELIGRIEQLTKSQIALGKIPTRKELGAKKVAKILGQFKQQKSFERAIELLGDDWTEALADMPAKEIVARLLTLMVPEIFQ